MNTDPASAESQVTSRLGPPYESEGTCEACNASGPVWMIPEGDPGWNQLPLCANCILTGEVH